MEVTNKMKRQPTEWEKNLFTWKDLHGINLQKIQTTHAAKEEKTKQPYQKNGRRSK